VVAPGWTLGDLFDKAGDRASAKAVFERGVAAADLLIEREPAGTIAPVLKRDILDRLQDIEKGGERTKNSLPLALLASSPACRAGQSHLVCWWDTGTP